jgi:hypothetical protein
MAPNRPLPGLSLAETHPELAHQAEGWDPRTTTSGSNKKVLWRCQRGHSWQSSVSNRVKGNGCPVCSGRIAESGWNDLLTLDPTLAAEAYGWDPSRVTCFSHQKVQWRCSLGHLWEARISERSSGNGCPYCSGHRVLAGFNDLATTHPEVAAQADGWDPTTVVAFANRKVSWACALGHKWEAWIGNRAKGSGCPYCSGHRVLAGFNDLATTHPEVAAQADGWDPTTVTRGSSKKLRWGCASGHIWTASVGDRTSGKGCPVCTNRIVQVGFNDLTTTNPELASEADGWDPTTVVAKSGTRVKWKCSRGHSWMASPVNRSKGTGCPVCTNRIVQVGFNDLTTNNPELASEADGWDPTTVVAFSNKKVSWKCSKSHRWIASVSSRSSGSGCPYCSGLYVIPGVTDLATTSPELAAEADGWDPSSYSASSNKKVGWRCMHGHQWKAMIGSRSRGRGCPICSGREVLKGFNDLATLRPGIAAEADGWDPGNVSPQSHQKLDWKCVLGHRWKATVKNRFRSGGCPVCSNKKLLVGFNDLLTTNPHLAAEAYGWDPKSVFANSDKKLTWRCSNSHIWKASANNRSQGKGCPSCAEYGFNPSKPGWLYFIVQHELKMLQIGITNVPENRLKKHSRSGWEVKEIRGPMDGYLVQSLELAALRSLKLRGAILGSSNAAGKFDGYSEAWTRESLDVDSIKQILDWVYEDDGVDS